MMDTGSRGHPVECEEIVDGRPLPGPFSAVWHPECAMLNKGPHIGAAIRVLNSILTRMQDHQDKKRSLLRRLHAWDHPDSSGDS